ncbi:MAG TPA: AsmA-like C-terminal region-containing protein, partial [Flavipsychrobacter sp.]|nr:AsmA-like C-terminal region-containing protein [Flavipsychrobacter sp.]
HIDIDANINNVHINDFLDAFENFGQTTISSKNIKGRFFAKAKISGNIKDNGDLVSRSLHGSLDFNLKDGALVNFEPLLNVGKFIFRKRRLENITFSDLKNTLDVKGDKIYIRPMLIESSALNAKVEGVYAIGAGTDILMDVPLRNPKKDELVWDDSLKAERQMKGLVLHLRAVDGEDGKVKIKWNRKEKEEGQEQRQAEKAEKKKLRLFKRQNKESN